MSDERTGKRAAAGPRRLSADMAAVAKGMLARGDRQHDIAAYFGLNAGRISELAKGTTYLEVEPLPEAALPPAGPYGGGPTIARLTRELADLRHALVTADLALDTARHALEAARRLLDAEDDL